jgi:hypothetical protein
METPTSIQEQIQRLIAFRQEIYSKVFVQRRDALMDTLDALLSTGSFPSFAMLSQSERFQRQWPSLYDAVERAASMKMPCGRCWSVNCPSRASASSHWMALLGLGPEPRSWKTANMSIRHPAL